VFEKDSSTFDVVREDGDHQRGCPAFIPGFQIDPRLDES
jgi:hypothetical protein